jgi:hypothetical protein
LFDNDQWAKDFDLLIDATASLSVLYRLEHARSSDLTRKRPVISVAVSSRCEYGIVRVSGRGAIEGPWAVDRRAKVSASQSAEEYFNGFWPEVDVEMFQPEPGCSDPTFRGSSADAAVMASSLLNSGLGILQGLSTGNPIGFCMLAQPQLQLRSHGVTCDSPKVLRDKMEGFNVVIQPQVMTRIQAEMQLVSVEDPDFETGGILLGELSILGRTAFVDVATGPPSDSILARDQFVCGVEGVKELVQESTQATRGSVQFIGLWHSHPRGRSNQSPTDVLTMVAAVLDRNPGAKWALMLIRGRGPMDMSAYLYSREGILSGRNGENIRGVPLEVSYRRASIQRPISNMAATPQKARTYKA